MSLRALADVPAVSISAKPLAISTTYFNGHLCGPAGADFVFNESGVTKAEVDDFVGDGETDDDGGGGVCIL